MNSLALLKRFALLLILSQVIFADATFDGMVSSGKYQEALDYADEKIPPANRDAAMWAKIAFANEKAGLKEKALASYMVSWRMNANNYEALLGSARIYNQLNQFDQGASMAQKALEQKFTGDASWEYARACIALKKPAEAKKALEKVIETDPGNITANRELGIIYFNDKQYANAISLLKKSYGAKADADVAYKIGKSYLETKDNRNAIEFLKKTVDANKSNYQAGLELARALFAEGQQKEAAAAYSAVNGKIKTTAQDQFNRAQAYENTGDKTTAISVYKEAIKKYGSSSEKEALVARNKVGEADLAAKNFSSAETQFNFLVLKDSKNQMFEDNYFNLADAQLGLKKRSEAISTLNKLIAFDKKNAEAYARLADLYTAAKNPTKAQATLEKLITLSPNDPGVYLTLGDYNLKSKNYQKALSLFVKANGLGKSPKALEGIAVSASMLNQWDKARDAAESAVLLDAKLIDARKVLADALVRGKSYAEAKDHLEMLSAKEPKNKKYLTNLAKCYDALKMTDKLAIVDKKLIVMDSKNSVSRFRYAEYALKTGKKDEAYGVFKELAVLKANNASVFKNLYMLAKAKGEKANAIKYLKTYTALNPKDAEMFRDLGDLQYEAKQYDGALASYRKVIALDPALKGFYKKYAEIVIKKGLQDEVIKALNGVIKNGGADHSTYTTLGTIYMKKNLFSKAKTMYNKALSINPQDVESLVSLGEAQEKLNDVSGAVVTYQQAVMMDPKRADAHKALGDLYIKQKKTDNAIKSYSKYLDLGQKSSAISKKVGDYYFGKKDYKTAAKHLENVTGKAAQAFSHQLNLCDAYYNAAIYDKAIVYVDMLMKRNPKVPTKIKLLNIKAEAYEKKKDSAKAVLAYDALYKLSKKQDIAFKRAFLREGVNDVLAEKLYLQNTTKHPNDSRNYLQLGLMYSKKPNKLSSSVNMLEKAAAKAGKDKKIWQTIAQLYGKMGNSEKELASYRKYLAVDPQDVEANVRIGTILIEKGKTTEGMINLETANALSPNNIKIMLPLAQGYLKTKRYSEAISILQKAKGKEPNNIEIRKKILDVYMKTGDEKSAMLEIEQLISKKRDNTTLRVYAELLLSAGKAKDAANAIEDILATDPEDIEALLILGKIHRSKGKFNEAVETYKEIAFIMPEHAGALYERAETYFEMSKYPWAERFYDRALRADPKMGRALIGKAKIAKNRNDMEAYKGHIKKALVLSPGDDIVLKEAKAAGLR